MPTFTFKGDDAENRRAAFLHSAPIDRAERLVEATRAANAIKRAPSRAQAIAENLVATRREIDKRWDLSDSNKAKGHQIAISEATDQARALDQEVRDAQRAYTDGIRYAAAAPPTGGAENELQRQAAWRRMQAVLDNSEFKIKAFKAQEMLNAAKEIGDSATINAARVELRSYLQSRNEDLDDMGGLAEWMDINSGVPIAEAARTLEIENNRSIYRGAMAAGHVYSGLQRNSNPPPVIPAIQEGEVINLPEYNPRDNA